VLLLQLLLKLLWKLQVLLTVFSSQVNSKCWSSLDSDHRRLCLICNQDNNKMGDGDNGGKVWPTSVSA